MSAEKATSPCNKFQANIFNKSKCQNCFKSRELHLLNDRDMEQAKPIYGGWLCLAPEGTDFDNPMQRSRKWQRRFFILYEHGSLSFALDELPSTLPQGTMNLNLCTDIADAEPRTGQRNALCIVTPEQEIFIRGDSKEIINGWSEQLGVYLRTNKQNQKKKRKVEPVATQEPSPAKMAATEDQQGRGPGVTPMWTVADTDPPGPEQTPAGNASTHLRPLTSDSLTLDAAGFISPLDSLDLVSNGNANSNNQLAESNNIQTSAKNKNQSRDRSRRSPTERLLGLEEGGTAVDRKGRSEARGNKREKLQSCGDEARLSAPPPQRRAKSLDRRTSDTVMTPDLLNFKKGWLVKLDENEQWKKYWFVLSTDSLRYYKDSIAEEASDLEGEIGLTKCFNVSEYQVQRNYGFQIHTPNGAYTLSAMTAGIRRNWIQALMKNVHPANAPDVASVPAHHGPCSPPEALPKPDVTPDLGGVSTDHKHRTVMERRREGRYKTFDWAEFRPQKKAPVDADQQRSKGLCDLELGDLERRKRREERRRRYESMLGISLGLEATGDRRSDSIGALSPKSQKKVEEDIEECWKLVETTLFRLDSSVPVFTDSRDSEEVEKLLDGYRKEVEDLKAQLAESERCRLELEAQLSAAEDQQQQLEPPLGSDSCPTDTDSSNSLTQMLRDTHKDAREQQSIITQDIQEHLSSLESPLLTPETPRIWLHDTEGNLQELGDLVPRTVATPLSSPASNGRHLFFPTDGEDVATKNHQNQLNRDDTDTLINNGEYSSLIEEEPADGDESLLTCCVERHVPPDQAVVRRLSLEVELLTSQNEALVQRNQEMLNQLTEADREIERLKAELNGRYTKPCHLPEVEQLHHTVVDDLEKELSSRNEQLLEAQTLISSLEENLKETEALLLLHEETNKSAEKAAEAELTELQKLREELKEAKELHHQTAAEAQAHIRSLNQELEAERLKDGGGNRRVSAEEKTRQVMEATVTRLSALGKLLEAIDKLDVGWRREETTPTVASQLRWEEQFWSSLLHKLEPSPSQFSEEKPVEVLLSEVTERMMVENRVLLLGHGLLSEADEGGDGLDISLNIASETETEQTDESRIFDHHLCEIKHFGVVAQVKTSWLEQLASSVSSSEQLQLMVERLYSLSEQPMSGLMHSAATEALYCCRLSRLRAEYEREQKHLTSCLACSSCKELMEENKQLRDRLSNLEELLSQTSKINIQDTENELQAEDEGPAGEENDQKTPKTPEEEMVESPELEGMETTLLRAEGQLEIQQGADDNVEETDLSVEAEQVVALRRRVEELEEQLSVREEELKEEFDGKMSLVQTQHEREMEKLKATCERGFASMDESHVKVVEELQRRHQQEVERLLLERDQLLEEESAATVTAIEAIKNAHRVELEREVQRRCQTESSAGNAHLEDIYRRHSEELTSYQRELQVLSQQFSLKCLENGHLVQALDAERKALCQCQQENQDLRTRNQELSGHLAAEITRLCSLAKQDALPLSQGMDVYEMEITLRVKESEVQCLKQEITSLKDELQSAQRDKRNATKKYKDVYTELSILRAKTEREMDELRENLRLAHRALDRTSP